MEKKSTYIDKLPTASLYDLDRLGHIPAIYFILDQYKKCLYVGQTENLANRFKNYQHCDRRKWESFKKFGATQIAWIHYHKTDLLYKDEQEWIKELDPPINVYCTTNYSQKCCRKKISPVLNHDLLLEFAQLRLEVRNARTKIAQKQKEVVSLIEEYGHHRPGKQPKIETQIGTLTIKNKYKWKYSQSIIDDEQKLNYRKEIERNSGTAQAISHQLIVDLSPHAHLLEENQ